MDVEPVSKGLLQLGNVANMGQKPQLDLAIVGADQDVAGLSDEGLADLAALFGANRDVLQVRVRRGQPPGGGRGQREGGMDPPGARRDGRHQSLGIGAAQLGQLAPVQQDLGQGVAGQGQVFEHGGIGAPGPGRGLLAAGQAKLAKQYVADLFGAGQIERVTDNLLGLDLQIVHAQGKLVGQLAQTFLIDLNPGTFHLGQHGGQGPLEGLIDGEQVLFG